MTRIALVSDVHGNLHALNRVLDDARLAGVDAVACLGDVSTLGPRPREVLDVIAERASWHVLGNHDEYMSKPELLALHSDADVVVSAVDWCRAELDAPHRDRIAGFTSEVVIDL